MIFFNDKIDDNIDEDFSHIFSSLEVPSRLDHTCFLFAWLLA
jgi:hypothetical protein